MADDEQAGNGSGNASVWLVIEECGYEPDVICGVFSSRERASATIPTVRSFRDLIGVSYRIEEWVIDEEADDAER